MGGFYLEGSKIRLHRAGDLPPALVFCAVPRLPVPRERGRDRRVGVSIPFVSVTRVVSAISFCENPIGIRERGGPLISGSVAIAARVHLRMKSLQILREILLVARHRLAIHSGRDASLESAKRSCQCGAIDVMQQCGESCALLSLFAALLTRASFAGRVTRLRVRTPATSPGSPSDRPLPSAHLVSFGGIIGVGRR
jgi:hypothetical protein